MEFEGDYETLSESQLDLVRRVVDEKGYKTGKIKVSPVGKKGDNYVAQVLRFQVDDGRFSMVGKVAPTNAQTRAMMHAAMLFSNETLMYEEFLAKVALLQEEEKVPESERFRFPAFYGSVLEEPNELILLEDLKDSDFVILDRMKTISNESVKLAVKNIAMFHSISFVLKEREPKLLLAFEKRLGNMWVLVTDVPEFQIFFSLLEKDITGLLEDEKHKELVTRGLRNLLTGAKSMYVAASESIYSVIQQGDCWTNNMMFRVENGESVQCCLIDYQISKISSPADDLLYMFLNCTDYAIRAEHYHEWIDLYYSELKKHLSYFGIKAETVYPREQLDKDLKSQGIYAFALSVMLCNMLVRDTKDVFDKDDFANIQDMNAMEEAAKVGSITNTDNETIDRFKTKLMGIINSCVELELL